MPTLTETERDRLAAFFAVVLTAPNEQQLTHEVVLARIDATLVRQKKARS